MGKDTQTLTDSPYTSCPVCEKQIKRGLLNVIDHRIEECDGYPKHVLAQMERNRFRAKPIIWLVGLSVKKALDDAAEGFIRQQNRSGGYKGL